MNASTITLLFKVTPGYMFRLDLVILRPILTFVLPDTVRSLGSQGVLAETLAHQMLRTAYRHCSLTVEGKKYMDG